MLEKNTKDLIAKAKPFTLKGKDWLQSNIDSTKRGIALQQEFDRAVRIGDVLETFGKKGPVNSETAWTSVLYHWFDNSKAKKELGLNPRPAIEGIKNSVQWMLDHGVVKK